MDVWLVKEKGVSSEGLEGFGSGRTWLSIIVLGWYLFLGCGGHSICLLYLVKFEVYNGREWMGVYIRGVFDK